MTHVARTLPAYLLLSLMLATTGCYEAGNKEDCVGFRCPAGGQWPEGGNITQSHLFLPDGVSSVRQFHAYFISDQSPDFPAPQLPGQCYQLVDPVETYSFREYIDVGPTITARGEGDEEFVLQRYTREDCGSDTPPPNGCSPDGRVYDFDFSPHEIAYLYQTVSQGEIPAGYFDARFTEETAEQMPFSGLLRGSYMPPAVRQLKPAPGVLQLKRGVDLEVEWEPRTPYDPDVPLFGIILFVDPTLATDPTHAEWPWACMIANTGHFVVPGEVINQLTPTGGIVQVGYISNEAVVTEEGRAINMFATECQASVWSVVD